MSLPIESDAFRKLEQIFVFFTTRGLILPWGIQRNVTGHLSPEILAHIANRWSVIQHHPAIRAGFILSLLMSPGSRIAVSLKPGAEQLIRLGLMDPEEYVRLVSRMIGTNVVSGYLDTNIFGSFPHVFAPVFSSFNDIYFRLSFLPHQLAALNKNARSHILICQNGRPGALVSSAIDDILSSSSSSSSASATRYTAIAFLLRPEHDIPSLDARLKAYGIQLRPSSTSNTPTVASPLNASSQSHVSGFNSAPSTMNASTLNPRIFAQKRQTPSFLRSSHPKIGTLARRQSQISGLQSARVENSTSSSLGPTLFAPRSNQTSLSAPVSPNEQHAASPKTAQQDSLNHVGPHPLPPPRYVKQSRIQMLQVDEVNNLQMRDASKRRKSQNSTDDKTDQPTEKRRRKSKTNSHSKSDDEESDDGSFTPQDVQAVSPDKTPEEPDEEQPKKTTKRQKRASTRGRGASKSAGGRRSTGSSSVSPSVIQSPDGTPSNQRQHDPNRTPDNDYEDYSMPSEHRSTPPNNAVTSTTSTDLPSADFVENLPSKAVPQPNDKPKQEEYSTKPDNSITVPLPEQPPVTSSQQASAEPETKPPVSFPAFRLEDILVGSQGVSEEDVRLIDDFLHGRYIKHEEIKEIRLSERIYTDIEKDVTKRETMWILLDYTQCRWRKVKRTGKVTI